MRNALRFLPPVLLLAVISGVYSNHFDNGFHFDDWHAVVSNPFIRDLHNIPRMFTDSRTMSVLPANQAYRPVATASLAVDYWVGKGLKPWAFQASTFFWFLVQTAAMFWLFRTVLELFWERKAAAWTAYAAAAWYALHPVSAETVNYVIQRADLYVALGMVLALATYLKFPGVRRWGLYLLPAALADLSKPTALIFPGLIFLTHVVLLRDGVKRAIQAALPSVGLTLAMAGLQKMMTPPSFTSASSPWADYVLTQPVVTIHYLFSWFLPIGLTADSARPLVTSASDPAFLGGVLFILLLAAAAFALLRTKPTRPAAFGLLWFLFTLVPTALMPLAEAENDHRMFLPFVGLSLAVTSLGALGARALLKRQPRLAPVLASAGVCLLAAYAYGVHERNKVWRDEESLWRDVSEKSPHNGRGLMNYGLALMAKGQYAPALDLFHRALAFTPNYSYLYINLGIANGAIGRAAEAEASFTKALALAPNDALPSFYLGRWLKLQGRTPEAIVQLQSAVSRNPLQNDARQLLMQIYAEGGQWGELRSLAADTLRTIPGDAQATAYLKLGANPSAIVANAASQSSERARTPEDFINVSLAFYQQHRYRECIRSAREALKLRPNYAEAYNNIAAGYQAMGEWDEAIGAAETALAINPNFQLARNNLAYARQQKLQATATLKPSIHKVAMR